MAAPTDRADRGRRRWAALAVCSLVAVLAALLGTAGPAARAAEAKGSQPTSLLAGTDVRQAVGDPKGTPLEGDALERRTAEIAGLVRCPVCQGMSIADSPSSLARQMKSLTRAMLAEGYTQDQILAYFRYSYGQFVMLRPSMKGASAIVWVAPIIALLLGGLVVWWWMLRSNRATVAAQAARASSEPPSEARAPEPAGSTGEPAAAPPPAADAELEPYLERVRRMVGGEPAPETPTRRNES